MNKLIFTFVILFAGPALAGDYYRSERNVFGGQNLYRFQRGYQQVYRSQKNSFGGENYYSRNGMMTSRKNIMGGYNYYGRSPFQSRPNVKW